MIANRTVVFGSVLVSLMLGLGTAQGEAATTAKSTGKTKAKAKTTASTKATRPLYSAERHRGVFPSGLVFMEHLQITSDSFHPDMKVEDRLECDCQHQQWEKRGDR